MAKTRVVLGWSLISLCIFFYPMFISIYVFLPLLIGVMGFLLIEGIEKGKSEYIMLASFYFINLEVNLALPFFLTIISTLLIYLLFSHLLVYFRNCRICTSVFLVLMIDLLYLSLLMFYDFIFDSTVVMMDSVLLYSLFIDLLMVVLL